MKEPKGPRVTKEDVDEKDVAEVLEDKEYIIYITPRGRKWFAADGFGAEDIDVIKQECIDLKEERDALRAECLDYAEDRERLRGELSDVKKTIRKIQQMHEAEVQDLKDRIMEAEAETNAIRKHKDEILKKHTEYADALDNDSVAFEEILGLAILMERGAKSMHEVSKMIQAKTEGRV